MDLIAHCFYGYPGSRMVPVESISVWIDRVVTHPVNEKSLKELLKQVALSGKMSIYASGEFKGQVDACSDTPLYTNGQLSVLALSIGSVMIWNS